MAMGARHLNVAVLGATGLVGQRLLTLLQQHPLMHLVAVAASPRSVGHEYKNAVKWKLPGDVPDNVADMVVQSCEDVAYFVRKHIVCVFSALDASVAGPIETAFADAGMAVFSNARSHRYDPFVPIILPLANPSHIDAVHAQTAHTEATSRSIQEEQRRGFIVCNPNCASAGVTLVLKALHKQFGVSQVSVVTLQAASGAGYPGVASLDLIDNVVPFIAGEEAKLEREPAQMLGEWNSSSTSFEPLKASFSATCTRVPVRDGHLACVSVKLHQAPANLDLVKDALRKYAAPVKLPSAPVNPIRVREEVDRPQPRLDRDQDGGYAAVVGRIRSCEQWHVKLVVLSHNTVLGAAGGALLNAELALHNRLLD